MLIMKNQLELTAWNITNLNNIKLDTVIKQFELNITVS